MRWRLCTRTSRCASDGVPVARMVRMTPASTPLQLRRDHRGRQRAARIHTHRHQLAVPRRATGRSRHRASGERRRRRPPRRSGDVLPARARARGSRDPHRRAGANRRRPHPRRGRRSVGPADGGGPGDRRRNRSAVRTARAADAGHQPAAGDGAARRDSSRQPERQRARAARSRSAIVSCCCCRARRAR